MAIETHRRIAGTIASEIGARPDQVTAAAGLLDGGATVPFVARYRKEATGGLDDVQLRTLADRLAYLRELEARREAILGSIREQGKLTPELEGQVAAAETKAVLEDLYLPFKPKRRTKAMIAPERGLEPLAEAILADRRTPPETLAAAYLSGEVPDAKEALAGTRDILTEQLGENAALLGRLRAFAKRMIADHTAAGKKMKAAAAEDGVTTPAETAEKDQAKVEQIEAAQGEAFDQVYVAAQIGAHDDAVALFKTFSTQGEESALRAFAAETLPTLEEHQAAIKKLGNAE